MHITNRHIREASKAPHIRVTMPRLRFVPASLLRDTENPEAQLRVLNNSLITAAATGTIREMERMLCMDAKVNAVDMDLNTSMHHVSIRGLSSKAERLLDSWHALINPRNSQGFTPLALASAAGRTGTVRAIAVRYPKSYEAHYEILEAANLAEKYKQAGIASMLRRIAKEGTGFLGIRAPRCALTVSSPRDHV
ncbi:MAG: hypothetical protein KGH94_00260 [Candidatus Micrarchaeota archaeon]|nr:hypothetical protein [Candidatus Micrarchaeota archaeon]